MSIKAIWLGVVLMFCVACLIGCSRNKQPAAGSGEKSPKHEEAVSVTYEAPLEAIAGFKKPDDIAVVAKRQNAFAESLSKQEMKARSAYARQNPSFGAVQNVCSPDLKAFDWKEHGRVSDAKDQGLCGACWAFATDAAFEGSMAGRKSQLVNASEQELLSCSTAGSCRSGFWAFDYLQNHGTTTTDAYPYTGKQDACRSEISTPLRSEKWAFVRSDGGIPTTEELKTALCNHGPIAVGITATVVFQRYTKNNGYDFSKPFNEHSSSQTNHAITVVGWDDDKHAWKVKNSWGTNWGLNGFGWVDYDSNHIGDAAAWVDVPEKEYALPAGYYSQLIQQSVVLAKQKPQWQQDIDWAITNSDSGGSVNCPDKYLATYPECALRGGRSCLMSKAIALAKAGDCNSALSIALITQCHNNAARSGIDAAGQQDICAFLRTK